MKKYMIAVVVSVVLALGAFAASEKVERWPSKFPQAILPGLYVGPETGTYKVTGDTINKLAAIRTCNPTVDIGAAAAATTVVATGTCSGIAVGDVIVGIGPAADDAAWDEGVLSGFAESANTVKLQYHADATGGDPASMVYYITYIKRSL